MSGPEFSPELLARELVRLYAPEDCIECHFPLLVAIKSGSEAAAIKALQNLACSGQKPSYLSHLLRCDLVPVAELSLDTKHQQLA
ncbi:MAG: hypothetical protein AAB459_02670 [Patescibacteria group bacterium]